MSEELLTGYVMGFIDAEASFSVSIKIQRDLRYGIRLDPVFSITQSSRKPLEVIANIIGAGRVIRKPGQEHLCLLVIDNMSDLANRLIPFLDRHINLLLAKEENYLIFREIVITLSKGLHKNRDTLKKLVRYAYNLSSLSNKARRRRSLGEIFTIIETQTFKQREPPGER